MVKVAKGGGWLAGWLGVRHTRTKHTSSPLLSPPLPSARLRPPPPASRPLLAWWVVHMHTHLHAGTHTTHKHTNTQTHKHTRTHTKMMSFPSRFLKPYSSGMTLSCRRKLTGNERAWGGVAGRGGLWCGSVWRGVGWCGVVVCWGAGHLDTHTRAHPPTHTPTHTCRMCPFRYSSAARTSRSR